MAFENPIHFQLIKKVDTVEIQYLNTFEITQGGPEVGFISLNGNMITSDLFGGPWIYHNNYVYIPIYTKFLWRFSFKLAQIDTKTLCIKIMGKYRDVIFIDKVENNRIFFYEDISKNPNLIQVLEIEP